jgi:accessory gene regulator B
MIGNSIAKYLVEKTNSDEETRFVLAYAVDMLALNILNVVLAISVGWLLGVFWATILSCLIVFAYRHTAGGAHSESMYCCSVITILSFPVIAIAGKFLSQLLGGYILIFTCFSLLIGFLTMIYLAPAENAKAPIISEIRRKRLKILSLTITLVLLLSAMAMQWQLNYEMQTVISLSVLWVSFSINKIGFKAFKYIDMLFVGKPYKGGETYAKNSS